MIRLTGHAIDRYWERVRPTVERDQARSELTQLVRGLSFCKRPEWVHDATKADAYAQVSDGIVLALVQNGNDFAALTVLTRAEHSTEHRKARNHKRQVRAKRRASRRKKYHDRVDLAKARERADRWDAA